MFKLKELRSKPEPKITADQQQGFSLLELLVVITIVGILIATSYRYLNQHILEAEKVALRSLARDFAVSVSMLRNKWIVEGSKTNDNGQKTTLLEQSTLHLSNNGWPNGTQPLNNSQQTAAGCAELWHAIMQYSVKITVQGHGNHGDTPYHVSSPNQQTCRFELSSQYPASFYFDYNTLNGEVSTTTN